MDLTWIKEAYEKWIQGEDVNFDDVILSLLECPVDGTDHVFAYPPTATRSQPLLDQHCFS